MYSRAGEVTRSDAGVASVSRAGQQHRWQASENEDREVDDDEWQDTPVDHAHRILEDCPRGEEIEAK